MIGLIRLLSLEPNWFKRETCYCGLGLHFCCTMDFGSRPNFISQRRPKSTRPICDFTRPVRLGVLRLCTRPRCYCISTLILLVT